jgi:2-methylcitrate dehydratase
VEEGFDLTTPLSFSIGAGASKALQLDEARTAAAVEICGDVIPLLVVRTTPISQWKGLNSSQTALSSMHGVFLASRGVTGPKYVIEGTNGLAQALGKSIEIEWKNVKLDSFDRLALKTYNTAIPAQSGVFCTIALHKVHPFDPADIVSVEAEVFQDAYDFTGAGDSVRSTMFTPRRMPTTACRTSWLSRSWTAMCSRRNSSPAGLKSEMSKI